jgi:hypothetical protein
LAERKGAVMENCPMIDTLADVDTTHPATTTITDGTNTLAVCEKHAADYYAAANR